MVNFEPSHDADSTQFPVFEHIVTFCTVWFPRYEPNTIVVVPVVRSPSRSINGIVKPLESIYETSTETIFTLVTSYRWVKIPFIVLLFC